MLIKNKVCELSLCYGGKRNNKKLYYTKNVENIFSAKSGYVKDTSIDYCEPTFF